MTSTIPFPADVDTIAFVGDVHADIDHVVRVIRKHGKKVDVFIQLGDFGYYFVPPFLDAIQEELEKHDAIFLFVDGNHENFPVLHGYPVDKDGVRRLRQRLWHLPRGFRWTWSQVRFLALGGAHSVDRTQRIPGYSWWPEEHLTSADVLWAINGGGVDVMVTHDCPDRVDIPGISNPGWFPEEEIRASENHRTILGGVVDTVRPSLLWCGHYHRNYQELRPYPDEGACLVTLLHCEDDPKGNVQVVQMDSLVRACVNRVAR